VAVLVGSPVRLSAAQRNALIAATLHTDGLFSFEYRANPVGEQYLLTHGLIERGYAYRHEQERAAMKQRAALALESALHYTNEGQINAADVETRNAQHSLRDLLRTRLYITVKGRTALEVL
jgi:hypothetical protein